MEDFNPNGFKTVEELQAALDAHQKRVNSNSQKDFDFLAPLDMHHLLYDTFGPESPIQLRKPISLELMDQMPFLKLVFIYLNRLEEVKELKLTSLGNLPVKWVKELYALKLITQEDIENGISKLYKESDSIAITNLKIIVDLAGLTKKRNGKLSLTKKGQKLLTEARKNPTNLFWEVFFIYFKKFNWGYHDGYQDDHAVQQMSGYLLYLVIQYGQKGKKKDFFSEKLLAAFPQIKGRFQAVILRFETLEQYVGSIISVRLFRRFFDYWGFTDVQGEWINRDMDKPIETTDVFHEIFYLDGGKMMAGRK